MLDMNHSLLVSEATALPTESQPLILWLLCLAMILVQVDFGQNCKLANFFVQLWALMRLKITLPQRGRAEIHKVKASVTRCRKKI